MGNAASSSAAGGDSVGGSSDSSPSYSFNDPASSGQGAVAYVPFIDSSTISGTPAATGVSGNRDAAAAAGPMIEQARRPMTEEARRRLFRDNPMPAGSDWSWAASSSARRLHAVSEGTGIIDGDRHSSTISIDSSPSSSGGRSSSSSNRVDSSSGSSNSSSEGSAVGNLVAMTGNGLGGYLRWRFSGVGRGRQSFASRRTAVAAGVGGSVDHTAPQQLIHSWTEGEGARAAVPVEREARDGFPRGVSSNVARVTPATAAAISGGASTPRGRLRAAFSFGSLSGSTTTPRSHGALSFSQNERSQATAAVMVAAAAGMRQTPCPRCGATMSISSGSRPASLRCTCGMQLSRSETLPSTAPTGPNSAVPTPVMQTSSSSSSASPSSSSSSSSAGDEEQQDEGSLPNRGRLREIRLLQAVRLSQPSPVSAPQASSPFTHARARARARVRARTRAPSWAHPWSTQRGGARAERWQSQGPQQTEAIAVPTGGSGGERPEGGSNSSTAGAGAGAGRFLMPFASFPRSRSFRASGDSGVTAPETGAGSGGGVMDIRWMSGTDGRGGSAVGRGYGNHLQVVMCSNCARVGVIESAEVITNRSMFYCSCGSSVSPATPEQLLTALFERGGRHGRRFDRVAAGLVRSRGAPQQLIGRLPTIVFKEDSSGEVAELRNGLREEDDKVSCRICLSDYDEGDSLRILPCLHKFHQPCIDEWLGRSLLCPLCNTSVDVVDTDPRFAEDFGLVIPPLLILHTRSGAYSRDSSYVPQRCSSYRQQQSRHFRVYQVAHCVPMAFIAESPSVQASGTQGSWSNGCFLFRYCYWPIFLTSPFQRPINIGTMDMWNIQKVW